LDDRVEASSALDGCQHADSLSFEMEINFPTQEELMWTGPLLHRFNPELFREE
jgi:hypothetical protein